MAAYNESTARLLATAQKFISDNGELNFSAESVVTAALAISNGDAARAEDLLRSMEAFSGAALVKLSKDYIASSRALIRRSQEILNRCRAVPEEAGG